MPKLVKLPFPLVTLNTYINAERRNKYMAASIKKKATEKCRLMFLGKKYKTPIELEIMWVQKDKRKDVDNIAFAKKFILDGMVEAHAIPNDGQKHVTGFRGEHILIGKEECVLIKIFEKGE